MRAGGRLAAAAGVALVLTLGAGCAGCTASRSPDAGPEIPVVHLEAGTHPGPLIVDGDVIFQGAGLGLTTVEAAAGSPLLEVPAGTRVTLRDLKLEGTAGQHTVISHGSLRVERVEVSGGRAAFRIEAGDAELSGLHVHDAEAALRLIEGEATLTDAMGERLSSAAYLVAGGRLTGTRLRARQAEYGLLTRPDGRVEIDDLDLRNFQQAGIGLVGGAGTLRQVVLEGPMPAGGLLANDLVAPLLLEDASLRDLAGVGVQVLRGEATLRRVEIDTVARDPVGDLGMGLFFHGATVTLEAVTVQQASGGGIQMLTTTGGARDLTLTNNGSHGIEAWRASTLELAGVRAQGNAGAGLAALEGAILTVSGGDLRTNRSGPALAECSSGAEVRLAASVLAEEPLGPCVLRY